jgi:hypothetical protein
MVIHIILFFLVSVFSDNQSTRKIDQKAFKVGETLKFSIGWEFIDAGTATLSVKNIVTLDNQSCYHFTAITHSNSFFSTLYKVRDTLESYVEVNGLFPVKYVKKTLEGDYRRNFITIFDHENGRAITKDLDSGMSEITVPIYVQDIISAFYFMRTQPVEIGTEKEVSVFDNGKYRTIGIKIIRKEKVSVEAGDFDCVVVQTPIGPFKNRSDLFIWLTDDERKIPVLMKSKIVIGSVRAELEDYSGTY